ncbi:MAG: AsnC family transcriptional regulator [Bacillota bacterium]
MTESLDELDKALVRAVQGDLPLSKRPYQQIGKQLGLSEQEVLARLRQLKEKGQLRRIAAILYHRRSGYQFNGMTAWVVPEDRCQEVGELMTAYEEISHVYQRPTYPDWPYNLFSMIHGQSEAVVNEVVRELVAQTGIDDYTILYSTEELKKVSMKYFCEDD